MAYTPQQKAEWAIGKYLSLRPRSEQEVRRYLTRKSLHYALTQDVIDSLLEKYKRLGYIDDQKYVESMAHAVIVNRKRGPSILKMKLQQAGISPELIGKSLQELSPEQMTESMERRLQKYQKKLSLLDPPARRAKAFQTLFSSGFSSSSIRSFLDEWLKKEYHTST